MPRPNKCCCCAFWHDGLRRIAGGAFWNFFSPGLIGPTSADSTIADGQTGVWIVSAGWVEDPQCETGGVGPRQHAQMNFHLRVARPGGIWIKFDAQGRVEHVGRPAILVDAIVVWVDHKRVMQGGADGDRPEFVTCVNQQEEACRLMKLDEGDHAISVAIDTVDGWANIEGGGWDLTMTIYCQDDQPEECEADDGIGGPDAPIGEPEIDPDGGEDQGGPGEPPDDPPDGGDGDDDESDDFCNCGCRIGYAILTIPSDAFPPRRTCSHNGWDLVYDLQALNGKTFILPYVPTAFEFQLELGTPCTSEGTHLRIGEQSQPLAGGGDRVDVMEVYRLRLAMVCNNTCAGPGVRADGGNGLFVDVTSTRTENGSFVSCDGGGPPTGPWVSVLNIATLPLRLIQVAPFDCGCEPTMTLEQDYFGSGLACGSTYTAQVTANPVGQQDSDCD